MSPIPSSSAKLQVVLACPLLNFIFLLSTGAHAVTTNWNSNSNGNFNDATKWDNGAPSGADAATLNRGAGVNYTVTFPGHFAVNPPVNYASNRLIVRSNTATLVDGTGAAIAPDNFTVQSISTDISGRGIIIGQAVGDDAVLISKLANFSGVAATIGDAAGAEGELRILDGAVTLTGNNPVNDALIVGGHGSGQLTLAGGAKLNITASQGSTALAWFPGSTGSATVTGAGTKWTNNAQLFLGLNGAATLAIEAGAVLATTSTTAGHALLGNSNNASGTATISGAGSRLDIAASIILGLSGAGDLVVTSGGAATSKSASFGRFANSTGTATIEGSGSTWTVNGEMLVGERGSGAFVIENGGRASNVAAMLGRESTGMGAATVVGPGSTWTSSGALEVGAFGHGTLTIEAGGAVANTFFSAVARQPGSTGEVEVSGAGSTWTSMGEMNVGLFGEGSLNVANGGRVTTPLNAYIGAAGGSNGIVTVTGADSMWTMRALGIGGDVTQGIPGGTALLSIGPGGIVRAAQQTSIFAGGQLQLAGGEFSTTAINFIGAGGEFQWSSGTLHVETFGGNLTNPSGGVLAPGLSAGSTLIQGNYAQQPDAALEIEIGGLAAGSQFDFVNIAGSAQLDGQLRLKLINGFVPGAGKTFAVLLAPHVSGSFDNDASGQRVVAADGAGSFVVHYGPSSAFSPNLIVLSDFVLGADFDEDGDVDGADLARWGDGFGTASAAAHMQGDADGDQDVDGADFLAWQRQRSSIATATANAAAVPEPTGWALIAVAFSFAVNFAPGNRSRRRRG